jgi:hypothetical protein
VLFAFQEITESMLRNRARAQPVLRELRIYLLRARERSCDDPFEPRIGSKIPYRRPLSAYREGLNATNPFYAALSFFKVITYAVGLRSQRRRVAKGPIADAFDEHFPGDLADPIYSGDGGPAFQEYAGKNHSVRYANNFDRP